MKVFNIMKTIEGELGKAGTPITMVWLGKCSQDCGDMCLMNFDKSLEMSTFELRHQIKKIGVKDILFTKGDIIEQWEGKVEELISILLFDDFRIDIETYGIGNPEAFEKLFQFKKVKLVLCLKLYGTSVDNVYDRVYDFADEIKLMPRSLEELVILLEKVKNFVGRVWVIPIGDDWQLYFDYVIANTPSKFNNVSVQIPLQNIVDIP